MDIEANLWRTCLILMETTAGPPDPSTGGRVKTRTDTSEIDSAVKPKKKKTNVKKEKKRQ
tara:strand:- start:1051 stop:1230 length:180 start_codon:yes stop_codon:yes gene_type:complete